MSEKEEKVGEVEQGAEVLFGEAVHHHLRYV